MPFHPGEERSAPEGKQVKSDVLQRTTVDTEQTSEKKTSNLGKPYLKFRFYKTADKGQPRVGRNEAGKPEWSALSGPRLTSPAHKLTQGQLQPPP